MSNPYVGEIRLVALNFAPAGWAFCNGALMPISENETLFNLIGTTYGGDGQNTFALPDLQSRVPIHWGNGPSTYVIAETGGAETVTLTTNQIPQHTHIPLGNAATGSNNDPTGNFWAQRSTTNQYSNAALASPTPATMNANMLQNTGGSQPHNNLPPVLALNFIISLFGVFPSQS